MFQSIKNRLERHARGRDSSPQISAAMSASPAATRSKYANMEAAELKTRLEASKVCQLCAFAASARVCHPR